MLTSEQINELASALSNAQANIIGAKKDSANPFFRSKYADLASVCDAIREPLAANGLAVVQTLSTLESGAVGVCTRLMHASGQWIEDTLHLTPKDNSPQGMGSAITYGRRYALAAITGCAQIDDDGEASMGRDQRTDPRGDSHKAVPNSMIAAAVDKVRRVLAKDIDEDATALELFDLHIEFNKHPDTYIAIGDALSEAKVLTKAQWRDSVKAGKALAERM